MSLSFNIWQVLWYSTTGRIFNDEKNYLVSFVSGTMECARAIFYFLNFLFSSSFKTVLGGVGGVKFLGEFVDEQQRTLTVLSVRLNATIN